AGADSGDVVQVAPDAFQLEEDRPRSGEFGGGAQAGCSLAGVRVGDAVGDGAGGAGARGVAKALGECGTGCGALEPAVLVEEADIEVEDPLADDVEAEVAGLDHAGVDRADGDLIVVLAADA